MRCLNLAALKDWELTTTEIRQLHFKKTGILLQQR